MLSNKHNLSFISGDGGQFTVHSRLPTVLTEADSASDRHGCGPLPGRHVCVRPDSGARLDEEGGQGAVQEEGDH